MKALYMLKLKKMNDYTYRFHRTIEFELKFNIIFNYLQKKRQITKLLVTLKKKVKKRDLRILYNIP